MQDKHWKKAIKIRQQAESGGYDRKHSSTVPDCPVLHIFHDSCYLYQFGDDYIIYLSNSLLRVLFRFRQYQNFIKILILDFKRINICFFCRATR